MKKMMLIMLVLVSAALSANASVVLNFEDFNNLDRSIAAEKELRPNDPPYANWERIHNPVEVTGSDFTDQWCVVTDTYGPSVPGMPGNGGDPSPDAALSLRRNASVMTSYDLPLAAGGYNTVIVSMDYGYRGTEGLIYKTDLVYSASGDFAVDPVVIHTFDSSTITPRVWYDGSFSIQNGQPGLGGAGTVVFTDTARIGLIYNDTTVNVGNPIRNMFDNIEVIGAVLPTLVSPENGSNVLVNSALPLQWNNIDPNTASQTTVDVMIGTEPNGAGFTLLDNGAISSTIFDASTEGTYYWRVNSYIEDGSVVADANGVIWSFTVVTDFPPTVDITTTNKMTWSGEAVPLTTIVTDDNTHTITWEGVSDVATDVITIDTTSAGLSDEAPEIKIEKAELLGAVSHVTVTVTVDDGINVPVSDTVGIDVYDSPCLLARQGQGLRGTYDRNFDCITDLLDFAGMAQEWLVDYAATGPVDK